MAFVTFLLSTLGTQISNTLLPSTSSVQHISKPKAVVLDAPSISAFDDIASFDPIINGVNGVYSVSFDNKHDDQKYIFKPQSQEAYIDHGKQINKLQPRRSSLKHGCIYGECYIKEVAAFYLDQNFARVPRTLIAKIKHPLLNHSQLSQDDHDCDDNDGHSKSKTMTTSMDNGHLGSLQAYQDHICCAEEIGPDKFSIEDVHRIGVLDIRILNCDRHLGNILVTKSYKLVPIDQGYSLPSYKDLSDVSFEWLSWPQCKEPFSLDTLIFIENLNLVQDATLLRALGIADESILANMLSTHLLKRCASHGMTLYEIANLIQRQGDRQSPSRLELLVQDILQQSQSLEASNTASSKLNDQEKAIELIQIVDDLIDELIDTNQTR